MPLLLGIQLYIKHPMRLIALFDLGFFGIIVLHCTGKPLDNAKDLLTILTGQGEQIARRLPLLLGEVVLPRESREKC